MAFFVFVAFCVNSYMGGLVYGALGVVGRARHAVPLRVVYMCVCGGIPARRG